MTCCRSTELILLQLSPEGGAGNIEYLRREDLVISGPFKNTYYVAFFEFGQGDQTISFQRIELELLKVPGQVP